MSEGRVTDVDVSESCPGSADSLDAITAVASTLEPPMPHERKHVLRSEAGIVLDKLLVRCARGWGALDVAIGDALRALAIGDRVVELGHSCIGDYAREELGIAPSTSQKMVRQAEKFRDCPMLRAAVWKGDVSARKAEVVGPVARGDAEAGWVARARIETLRGLRAAVGSGEAPEEPWDRVCLPVPDEVRPVLEHALDLAGTLLGSTAPKAQRLEVIGAEYLGVHAAPGDEAEEIILHAPVSDWLDPVKEWLEQQTKAWSFLDRAEPVAAPGAETTETDPWELDAELRRLAGLRARWDEAFGHLAMLFRMLGLWRDAQFASFGHYCDERLHMARRTVEQRIWLERRFHELPALRKALRERRVSYEKARVIASHATDASVDEMIARAEGMTCIALRRALETEEEQRQICARKEIDLRVPRSVALLLASAMAAARKAAGKWIPASECLRIVAQHFIDTWDAALKRRSTVERRVFARDKGYCQKPACSKAGGHAHHIDYRSHGGSDEEHNRVSLCAVHHLRGVHRGRIRVTGRAPDDLKWEITGSRRRRPL
jgi:hypothetical protein